MSRTRQACIWSAVVCIVLQACMWTSAAAAIPLEGMANLRHSAPSRRHQDSSRSSCISCSHDASGAAACSASLAPAYSASGGPQRSSSVSSAAFAHNALGLAQYGGAEAERERWVLAAGDGSRARRRQRQQKSTAPHHMSLMPFRAPTGLHTAYGNRPAVGYRKRHAQALGMVLSANSANSGKLLGGKDDKSALGMEIARQQLSVGDIWRIMKPTDPALQVGAAAVLPYMCSYYYTCVRILLHTHYYICMLRRAWA